MWDGRLSSGVAIPAETSRAGRRLGDSAAGAAAVTIEIPDSLTPRLLLMPRVTGAPIPSVTSPPSRTGSTRSCPAARPHPCPGTPTRPTPSRRGRRAAHASRGPRPRPSARPARRTSAERRHGCRPVHDPRLFCSLLAEHIATSPSFVLPARGHCRSGGDELRPFGSGHRKTLAPDSGTAEAQSFPTGEGPQVGVGRSPGQGFRNAMRQEQVGGTRGHETTALARAVLATPRSTASKHVRLALYFVENDPNSAPDQVVGVPSRAFLGPQVIECQVEAFCRIGSSCTSVILPVCRAPMNTTTGDMARARSSSRAETRGRER